MLQQLFNRLKSFTKPVMALVLIGVLFFGYADSALAARSGGRIGGGSFRRAPSSRTYTSPRSGGGGYYGGGGFGFPFLIPFFGFGGGFGGVFSIILVIGLANFLMRSLREAGAGQAAARAENPTVSVTKLQIGLLAEARYLQDDLSRMALSANTASSAGLTQVLQEATLSLLRHPEYWQYAAASAQSTRLVSAEQAFNQAVLAERSKFTGETLSNVNSSLQQAAAGASLTGKGSLAAADPGAYIVATIVVASQGKLNLPKVSSTQDIRQALSALGSVSSDRLLAVEILWTPQASGESLTADEIIAEYPDLTLV